MNTLQPSAPDLRNERLRKAWMAFAAGAWDQAATAFDSILRESPTGVPAGEAHFGRAHALAQLNDMAEAAIAVERALILARDDAPLRAAIIQAWAPYSTRSYAISPVKAGLNKAGADQLPERITLLRLLAAIYEGAGDYAGAIAVHYVLLSIAPRSAAGFVAVGRLWAQAQDTANAANMYRKALALDPTFIPALDGLAEALWIEGQVEEARDIYARRAALSHSAEERTATLFKAATIQPAIAMDAHEIDDARARMDTLLAAGPPSSISDPWRLGLGHNFYADYHARPDRTLQEATAAYFLAATPSLGQIKFTRAKTERPRIGMVSGYFCGHTVGYLTRGLIQGLDQKRFDLVLFRTPGTRFDDVTTELAAAAPMVDLPADLEAARQMISDMGLDILHYPEIGMDRFTYFLAFARLAQLQTVGWGHPITTGIPNIDLFLSVDDMEPPDGMAHYSERLVRLRTLSIDVTAPKKDDATPSRNDLGLVAERPAYVCAQSLYKLHHLFDATLGMILQQDREGMLYFLSHSPHADALFLKRLERSLGANMARVRILPRVSPRGFLHLLRAADVLLDVPQWAGGKTSLESLAMGTPIVHQPGEFMRGRHTLAFLRKMEMTATVVDSATTYADTAVRLVHDKDFRREVRGQIAERSHRLFGDTASIREIENVWIDALKDKGS